MTGQEAVIRHAISLIWEQDPSDTEAKEAGYAALAALVAERDRYRDALEFYAESVIDGMRARAALAVSTP